MGFDKPHFPEQENEDVSFGGCPPVNGFLQHAHSSRSPMRIKALCRTNMADCVYVLWIWEIVKACGCSIRGIIVFKEIMSVPLARSRMRLVLSWLIYQCHAWHCFQEAVNEAVCLLIPKRNREIGAKWCLFLDWRLALLFLHPSWWGFLHGCRIAQVEILNPPGERNWHFLADLLCKRFLHRGLLSSLTPCNI